jgi:para-nitrobenzyl esterase
MPLTQAGWMSGAEGFSRRAVLAGGVCLAACGTNARADADWLVYAHTIEAPDGAFRGELVHSTWATQVTESYLGIRYATAKRFQAPTAVPPHQGIFEAKQFGSPCPQTNTQYIFQNEDCLYLNVWKPYRDAKRLRPVMVYFHGGAYSTGSVTDPLNIGSKLAERGDVVVVTVNHRLNALGYLYMPDRFPDSGNNGQLDLILALQWGAAQYRGIWW